ncbi:MAG: hypothetical protein KJ709_04980 [Nanoarchaeota archaeon]|nr:hypothetical protein [Nanoarchaeota archaeon]
MEEKVELIIHNGRVIPQKVRLNKVTNRYVISGSEYEELRKKIHPSFLQKIKYLFKSETCFVDLNKGKLL